MDACWRSRDTSFGFVKGIAKYESSELDNCPVVWIRLASMVHDSSAEGENGWAPLVGRAWALNRCTVESSVGGELILK
jgi:hypothetical protein